MSDRTASLRRIFRLSFGSAAIITASALGFLLGLGLFSPEAAAQSCCTLRGNVDCDPDGNIDIADFTRLIDYMYISFNPLCCDTAANIDADADGIIDIADLTRLVDFMYISFQPLPPCGAGQTLTFAQRQVLFDALDSAYNSLFGLPGDSLAHRLTAYLATRPELEAVGVADSVSVWARFTDGRMVMIPNNRLPGDSLPAGSAVGNTPSIHTALSSLIPATPQARSENEASQTAGNMTAPRTPGLELPQSVNAFIMSTLGDQCFSLGSDKVRNLIWYGGYAVAGASHPEVADLSQVRDCAVFYIDSHGGVCKARNGDMITGIWTQTPFSDAGDLVFAPNLDSGQLVYMYAKGELQGACKNQWRYAFTGKFVSKYMTFVKNSFVYISACSSDAPSLRNGFRTAGASVYAGWSMPVTDRASDKAGIFLINRLLGDNSASMLFPPPANAEPWESPPQRAFDISSLQQDMHDRNLDWDPTNGSELVITRLQDDFGLLAPSIRYMVMPANTDSFLLTGYFGSNPGSKGHVRVNGIERLIYTWDPTMVTVQLPKFGLGSVGPVTVEVEPLVGSPGTQKRISNTVNLTEWKGQFTYTHKDTGTLVGTVVINAHLRTDIHAFREAPHTDPVHYSVFLSGMDDTYGTASASGTASYTDQSDPPTTTTWAWSGSTLIDSVGSQSPYAPYVLGYFVTNTHKLQLDLHASNTTPLNETVTISPGGGQYDNLLYFSTPIGLADQFPWKFIIDVNTGWDILAGERNATSCCSRNPLNDSGLEDIKHKISWPTIPAVWPPDTTAAQ